MELAGVERLLQLPLVAREAEEVVLLRDLLRRGAVLQAATVDQFVRIVELLAANAVEAVRQIVPP